MALKYRPKGVCERPNCGNPVAAGMVGPNSQRYFCTDYCKRNYYYFLKHPKKPRISRKRYRPAGICERPNCGNPVAGGMVGPNVKGYFCSPSCRQRRNYALKHPKKPFISRKRYRPGGVCEVCAGDVPGGMVGPQTKRYICSAPCRRKWNCALRHLKKPLVGKWRYRPEGVCEACGEVVPAGMVGYRTKRYFCSKTCARRGNTSIGICELCKKPIHARKGGNKSNLHQACLIKVKNERVFAPTGPFAPVIKEYLDQLPPKRVSCSQLGLTHFFGYVYTVEKITTLKDIKPSVVGRFVAYERARGMTTCTATSAVSNLFLYLMDDDDDSERFEIR
jgi:hypothetical protein